MNGRKILLDSNIIIYLVKEQLLPSSFIQTNDQVFVSDVSYMETLGYPFSSSSEKQQTELLLSVFNRVSIEEQIVQQVISMKQSHKIKLPDAIIAATALIHRCILITRNTADFTKIPNLLLFDPFD
jgi:predicted nucleic acid-binding protein